MALAPDGPTPAKQGIPPRRLAFFFAMVALILFLLWFIAAAIYHSRPHRESSVYQTDSRLTMPRLLGRDDAAHRHAARIAVDTEQTGQLV
jgi:hypothetical protein